MAKKKNTNVTKLAKGDTNTKKKTNTKKEESNSVDVMAKERVNKLLNDVNLTPKDEESDLLVLDEKNMQSIEWLQDQISKLSEENEILKREAEEAKEDYKKIYSQYQEAIAGDGNNKPEKNLVPDSIEKNNIISLFNEFQKNYLGQNPERTRYTEIKLPHLMNKLISNFPFLKELKRF